MSQEMIPVQNFQRCDTSGRSSSKQGVVFMIYYILAFLIVAAIAGFLGFSVLAGTVALAAQIIFYIFVATLLVSLLADKRQHTA
jgi:uncharacterized membrane protein YtjA (UPF0391 family)